MPDCEPSAVLTALPSAGARDTPSRLKPPSTVTDSFSIAATGRRPMTARRRVARARITRSVTSQTQPIASGMAGSPEALQPAPHSSRPTS